MMAPVHRLVKALVLLKDDTALLSKLRTLESTQLMTLLQAVLSQFKMSTSSLPHIDIRQLALPPELKELVNLLLRDSLSRIFPKDVHQAVKSNGYRIISQVGASLVHLARHRFPGTEHSTLPMYGKVVGALVYSILSKLSGNKAKLAFLLSLLQLISSSRSSL